MNKNIWIGLVVVLLVGAGIYAVSHKSSNNSASDTQVASTSTGAGTSPVADTTSAPTDQKSACAVLTAAMIKSATGITVGDGVAESSYIGGSTCKFKSADGPDSVILQLGSGAQYYNGDLYPGAQTAGIGDKSFYQVPDSGNANAGALKGSNVIVINIYSKSGYTGDQVKALLKVVADQI
jgi:hypothetical protein